MSPNKVLDFFPPAPIIENDFHFQIVSQQSCLIICSPFANGRGPVGGHSLLKREPLPTVVPMRFLAPFGPPIAALPRKRLAFSAAGSAAPLSPQPPEEKPGGVSTSPPAPLTTQEGRGCGPSPLGFSHPGIPNPAALSVSGELGKRSWLNSMTTPIIGRSAPCGDAVLRGSSTAHPAEGRDFLPQ